MWWLPLTNVTDDRAKAIDEIAMTLASAGNHLSRFTTKGKHIPDDLLDNIKRLGQRYNSDQHDKPDSANRELIKELGFSIIFPTGSPSPARRMIAFESSRRRSMRVRASSG